MTSQPIPAAMLDAAVKGIQEAAMKRDLTDEAIARHALEAAGVPALLADRDLWQKSENDCGQQYDELWEQYAELRKRVAELEASNTVAIKLIQF